MNMFFRLFIYQLKVPFSVGWSSNLMIFLIDVTFSVSYKADSTVLGKSMRTTSIPFKTSNSNSNHRPYLPPMISHKSNTRKTTTNFNNFLLTLSNLFDQFQFSLDIFSHSSDSIASWFNFISYCAAIFSFKCQISTTEKREKFVLNPVYSYFIIIYCHNTIFLSCRFKFALLLVDDKRICSASE